MPHPTTTTKGITTMFRTPTGQTGIDAYRYELAAIENAKRELDARMVRLTETIARELPENAEGSLSIATDRFPDASHPLDRSGIVSQLTFHPSAERFTFEQVRETLDRLTPETVAATPAAPTPATLRTPDVAAVLDAVRDTGASAISTPGEIAPVVWNVAVARDLNPRKLQADVNAYAEALG